MIRSLRESKARLSELVELASRGEDVMISVRGKVKARLTRAGATAEATIGARWARELRALQRAYSSGKPRAGVEQILSELSEDRL